MICELENGSFYWGYRMLNPDILIAKVESQGINSEDGKQQSELSIFRTEQLFFVPIAEICDNDYDLSINRYKEIIYEEIEYDPPKVILKRLAEIEIEILIGRKELEEMLG